jgi:hypothetical protein
MVEPAFKGPRLKSQDPDNPNRATIGTTMKITLIAISWSFLALGVCSRGLAQHGIDPIAGEAGLSEYFPSRIVHLDGEKQPNSPMPPAVSAGDFQQPISNPVYAPCCNDSNYAPCCDDSDGLLPGYRVRFAPYGWLSEIHGSATLKGVTRSVHISTRDLLNLIEHNAHFFFMGKLEIDQEQGPFGIITNAFYVNAGYGTDIEGFRFSKKAEHAIVDVAFKYELTGMPKVFGLPPCSKLDLLAGFRYWMFDSAVTVTAPAGNSASFDGKRDWVDPFIGVRAVVPFNCYSSLHVRADAGGFDWGTASKSTWNFEVLVEAQCSTNCALRAGYRLLDVDNQRGSGKERFAFDLQYRGPVAELVFTF